MKAPFWITAISLFALSVSGIAQQAQQGTLDLSHYNFEVDGAYGFSGTWEFYWNQLLEPADFNKSRNPQWMSVPGSWNRQGNYPAIGFATYRLKLILPEKRKSLVLYFPSINSAAKIWVNGILITETGVVSTDQKTYSPKLTSTTISLPDNVVEAELVIQVVNFTYFSGGLAGTPRLDTVAGIVSSLNRMNGVENFFAGSLIAMFIYQLILYFVYYRGKPYLWLALICLGVALRAMIVHGGSFLLPNLFPTVTMEYWKKIEFIGVYASVALFPLYVYHLFIDHSPKKPIVFFVTVASFLCLAVITTPQHIYGKLLDVCHVCLLLSFVYAVYSISRAWRAGNKDARVILVGVLTSFPFILAEILKNSLLYPLNIKSAYMVELGVLVFLLFQVYLLANHYAKSYKNLEKTVEERTGELTTANTVKNRLLSVMSHDIKSPLNSLRGILQVYNKGLITKEEFNRFAQQLEGDLGKTSMLVENILFWTASQLKGIRLQKEKFDLKQLTEENMRLFETIAANKKIEVKSTSAEIVTVEFDRNILNMVLRNLISNAIKFSYEGGRIDIVITQTEDSILLQVKDQGIGMDDITIQSLLDHRFTVSTSGTIQEKGTGLGLSLCRDYLQKAGGLLTIESAKGKGSSFNVVIPV